MKDLNCEKIEGLLVDYADGDISADQREQVAEHLSVCADCRRKVGALQRSLMLTEVIWADAEKENESVRTPSLAGVQKGRRVGRFVRFAVAAGILLVIGFFAADRFMNALDEQTSGGDDKIAMASATTVMTIEEIKRDIDAQGRAAELLSAANLLNDNDLRKTALQQYEYIVDMYPETSSAAAARMKIRR